MIYEFTLTAHQADILRRYLIFGHFDEFKPEWFEVSDLNLQHSLPISRRKDRSFEIERQIYKPGTIHDATVTKSHDGTISVNFGRFKHIVLEAIPSTAPTLTIGSRVRVEVIQYADGSPLPPIRVRLATPPPSI